jgi:hypothetical protein
MNGGVEMKNEYCPQKVGRYHTKYINTSYFTLLFKIPLAQYMYILVKSIKNLCKEFFLLILVLLQLVGLY